MKHEIIYQSTDFDEMPMQLGIVLFGLYFGFRLDIFTSEFSLSFYCGKTSHIFSWFLKED
jgi:hypothetical protein